MIDLWLYIKEWLYVFDLIYGFGYLHKLLLEQPYLDFNRILSYVFNMVLVSCVNFGEVINILIRMAYIGNYCAMHRDNRSMWFAMICLQMMSLNVC